METIQDRVERGLAQLGKDIITLVKGKHKESNETIVESDGIPVVQNIINNYTNRTESPVQIRKFNFIDVFRIVLICTVAGACVAFGFKLITDPAWFVNGFNSWIKFFQGF